MGGTVSRPGGVENPFPVGPSLSKDLDLLTTVAVRLLSSSDIYDITNLKNPGVCGSYAVFVKKNIEKRLLSFVADISGAPVEVLYQNPSKMLPAETRKKICKDLAQTMVTLVSTVVALLASIQVKSDSRMAAASGAVKVPVQAGGADIADVIDWFYTNGLIQTRPEKTTDEFITLDLYSAAFARLGEAAPKFKLRLNRRISPNRTYMGTLSVSGGANFPPDVGKTLPPFPAGGLNVQVMAPIRIPGVSPEETILPFQLADRSRLTWMAGALYRYVFFSSAGTTSVDPATGAPKPPAAMNPFDVWADIFRRTQGFHVYTDMERSEDTSRAAEAFSQYMRTQDSRAFFQALAPYLSRYTSYSPEAAAGYAPAPYMPPGYPPAGPYGAGAVPYGAAAPYMARPPPAPLPPAVSRPAMPALAATTTVPTMPGSGATYDISAPSADRILSTLRNYRELIPDESSPAAVRAFTLAGKVNPDRTVNTAVCNDPYWRIGGLHMIYPWATLQFLCVNDWEKLGTSGGKDVFHKIWTDEFLAGLRRIYNGEKAPSIAGPADNQVLNGLTFSGLEKVELCKESRSPRVRFIKIQDGLLSIQGRYERHVRSVWELLNSLIIVIVDPATREQTVRLHPRVYAAKSKEYVDKQADAARNLLTAFYLGVEKDYLTTIAALTTV